MAKPPIQDELDHYAQMLMDVFVATMWLAVFAVAGALLYMLLAG